MCYLDITNLVSNPLTLTVEPVKYSKITFIPSSFLFIYLSFIKMSYSYKNGPSHPYYCLSECQHHSSSVVVFNQSQSIRNHTNHHLDLSSSMYGNLNHISIHLLIKISDQQMKWERNITKSEQMIQLISKPQLQS